MATNKTYHVIRVDKRFFDNVDIIYEGRIRDCKRSLNTIEKEYKKRGWETLNTGFTLYLYEGKESIKSSFTYSICEIKQ